MDDYHKEILPMGPTVPILKRDVSFSFENYRNEERQVSQIEQSMICDLGVLLKRGTEV